MPFKEHSNTISSELLTVLDEQTLMDTLLCVHRFPIRFRIESLQKQSIRRPFDKDGPVSLYERVRFFEISVSNIGEFEEGRGDCRDFEVIVTV